jgi:alpha-tubulin suppressor-like RCC1 family protein
VAALLTSGVRLICANEVAFTAIKMDGSVVAWGNKMSVGAGGLLEGVNMSGVEEC